jgi:TatD DNase family protein
MFTDTHCHFSEHPDFDAEGAYVGAVENGVDLMINVAFDVKSSFDCMDFASKHNGVYFTAGIHPDSAEEVTEENLKKLMPIFSNEKCLGVGEIGLDYHYGKDKETQIKGFVRQIELANELSLPFSVHSRDCTQDMVDVLKANRSLINNGAIMHCYSGSLESAKIYLDLGFYISFSGTLTFKNARSLPEVCAYLPMDRILSETDTPYLAPVPLRGTINEPKNVRFVAEKIAEIKNLSVEDVAKAIRNNATNLYKKLK